MGNPVTVVIEGAVAATPDPEPVGGIHSKDISVLDWDLGVEYSAGFPVYGALGGSDLVGVTGDYYALASELGLYLFLSQPGPRGPAPVSFFASPDVFTEGGP